MLVETGKSTFCLSLDTGKQSGTFRLLSTDCVVPENTVSKRSQKTYCFSYWQAVKPSVVGYLGSVRLHFLETIALLETAGHKRL